MTMSSRPRVLTEQDAGSMDTLIRRGEQAATAAEQKAQQLQNAAADLEQVKGTIPAAAQSAATLATAQAKSTLDAAANSAAAAAAQATLALATLPKFRSVDVNNPPAPTQAELDANPNGLGGTRLTADGATQPLRWTPHTLAGAWVTVGAPTATAPQVQAAKDLAESALVALGNLTLVALNARGQVDGPQLVDGSRWIWQPTGTPNGGTIVAAAGGGVWVREYTGPLDPRWFGAVPHVEGQPPVDSGAALAAWIAAVEIGQTLATDRVFYTGRELVCNIDSVTVDWQGQLRPMPGYTGFLLRITGLGTPQKQFPASLWQTTARVYALNVDGENRSRGVWFQHLDHYVVENVQVRRTNGCAIRIDACREGAFRNLLACLSRQGTDRGVVEFVDQNAGADANNTMRVYDLKSIYNLGTHLAIDTPLAAQSAGSAARLIDFYGIQIETVGDTVGNSQLDNVFTPTITNGQFVASQVYDPTVDLVTIRNANVINFFGGHFFFDTVQLPPAGVARGGVGIRLGYDSEPNLSNSATNISFHRCAMFAHNGNGFIFGLHFAQNILTDVVLLDGLNTRPLAWVSDSSSDAATRLDRTWVTAPAATAAFKAVGVGGAASAAYAMRSGNSASEAQLYMFPHQVYIKPDAGTDVQHVMDSQGRVWVAGAAKGQLGIPGAEYEQVRLQSGDGSRKLRLYVATDGRLLLTDEVQTWEVNRTQV